jgi:hypothetical protein
MAERTFLTAMMWFMATVVLAALFISAAAQGVLTIGHLSFAFAVLSLVVIATPLLARWKDGEAQFMKSKRERIDNVLRDMSDTELLELKQRLTTGEINDENILDYLGDDGELVARK